MVDTKEEIQEYIRGIEEQLKAQQLESQQATNAQHSMFGYGEDDNLIKWQLDLKEDMDRIYHLLKGHEIKEDGDGNLVYVEPKDKTNQPFNEFGVQLIMNVMSFYLNRNTILSNYSEEMINHKVLDFGREMKDLIFLKYEQMGMDTKEKRKLYQMIVRELIDVVHSAYLRAYKGGERESLGKRMMVTQSSNTNNSPMGPTVESKPRFSMFRPSTW